MSRLLPRTSDCVAGDPRHKLAADFLPFVTSVFLGSPSLQDLLVQKLADNAHFQRFAVRTVETVQGAQRAVEQGVKDPAKVQEASSAFWTHFKREVMKDVRRMNADAARGGAGSAGGGGAKGGSGLR